MKSFAILLVLLGISVSVPVIANDLPAQSTSAVFTLDMRGEQPTATSGLFTVDTREIDGMVAFAESGVSGLDTGGHAGFPIVDRLSPSPIPALDGRQWISIHGRYFLQGARVSLRTGNETFHIPVERTQWISPTEIRVFVNLTSEPALWTAQVINPDGFMSARMEFDVIGSAVSPVGEVDFGTRMLGNAGTRSFTLRNTGNSTVNWSAALGGMFSFEGDSSGTLATGESIQITISYNPTTVGPHAATARFNIGGQIHQRELKGRGVAGEIDGTSTLTGRVIVINELGMEMPIKGAYITLRAGTASTTGTTRKLYTDWNGSFEVDRLSPGIHQVTASPDLSPSVSYEQTTQEIMIEPGENTMTIILNPKPPYVPPAKIIEPVVLVRGMGRKGKDENDYWAYMHAHLTHIENMVVWDPNLNANGNEVIDGEESYNDNAQRLNDYLICEVARHESDPNTEVRAIHLVAHSMGGLICRRMISNELTKSGTDTKLPEIKTLITLSTPHAGSPVASAAVYGLGRNGLVSTGIGWTGIGLAGLITYKYDWAPDWDSTKSLIPSVVLNQDFQWPIEGSSSKIRLAVLGGNTPGVELKYKLADYLVFNNLLPEAASINDGAVSLPSSLGYYYHKSIGAKEWQRIYSFPQAEQGSGWLIQPPSPENFNHEGIKSSADMRYAVGNILKKRLSSSQNAPEVDDSPAPMPMNAEEPFRGRSVDTFRTTVSPQSTQSFQAPLTGQGAAKWMVSLSDRNLLVRLESPNHDGWITGSGPGVDWEVIEEEGGDGRLVVITLHNPAQGMWGVEFDGAALGEEADTSVSILEEGGPLLEAEGSDLVANGAALALRAMASLDDVESNALVLGGSVEAIVIAPDGTETIRTLPDDGLNGDDAASDGIHGLLAEEFSQPGNYEVVFRYNGMHPNGGFAFRRLTQHSFTRAASGGFIAGIEGHRTVDVDEDGYPESIILDVRVDNTDVGGFTLSGRLAETGGDATFQAVTEFQRNSAEAGIINLVFDKRNLPMGRECGPFELSELRLSRGDEDRAWLHGFPAGYSVSTRMLNTHARQLRVSGDFDFGMVKVGQSATQKLRIHNDGWMPLIVSDPLLPEGFSGRYEGEIDAGGFVDVDVTFTPTESRTYGGSFEIPSDANIGGQVEALWSGVGYTGILLGDWLADQGVPEDQRGPQDDPYNTGIPNLLAYLFNLSPTSGAANRSKALPTPHLGNDTQGRYLSLRYRHFKDAERLIVSLETSEDLTNDSWEPVTNHEVIELGVDPETGDRLRELRVRMTDAPISFVRMAVKEAP